MTNATPAAPEQLRLVAKLIGGRVMYGEVYRGPDADGGYFAIRGWDLIGAILTALAKKGHRDLYLGVDALFLALTREADPLSAVIDAAVGGRE